MNSPIAMIERPPVTSAGVLMNVTCRRVGMSAQNRRALDTYGSSRQEEVGRTSMPLRRRTGGAHWAATLKSMVGVFNAKRIGS